MERFGSRGNGTSSRNASYDDVCANLLAQDLEGRSPVVNLKTKERPSDVETIQSVAENDDVARRANVVH